jgi:predicted nucleic acid-binding protein
VIVVADTSVILNLCRVEEERLLQQLFVRVLVPREVATEFTRLSSVHPRFAGLILPVWIESLPAPPTLPPEVLRANLDIGESAAIALCLAQNADLLLMDETLGREVAAGLGLRTIGILGVLIQAHRSKLIPSLTAVLERLAKEAGFWIAPALRARVVKLVGEDS